MVQQFNESAGNTAFSFNGNEDEARKLIPTAQNLLYKLRGFLATSGSKVFSMTTRASNGSVTASSIEGIEKVIITADGQITDESVDVEGIEILSGAVKGGEIAIVTPPVMGEPQFKTLQKYKPTDQAYKYPLKKRPGNYPKTVILPGNTFEDQPRLAVIEQNLIARPMGYRNYVFIGDEAVASTKKTIADDLISDALATLDAVVNTFKTAVVPYSWGYIKYECYYGQTTGFYACIYAEIQSNYMHQLDYNLLETVDEAKFNTTTDVNSTKVPVTLFSTIIETGNPNKGAQSGRIASSMYSGLMKKVVQVIQGYGMLKTRTKNALRDAVGVQLKYDWRWSRCHGIVVGAGGVLWLVEISCMHGVVAMPLPLFENTKKGTPLHGVLSKSPQDVLRNAVGVFGGLPSGAGFPPVTVDPRVLHQNPNAKNMAQSIASGDVLQLVTPAGMSGYFDGISYSNWLGWSFSDSGHEAHNTCADWDGNGRHYKITFTIGAVNKNRAVDEPIAVASASLALVSSVQFSAITRSKFCFYDGDMHEDNGRLNAIIGSLHQVSTTNTEQNQTTILATHINGSLELVWSENIPWIYGWAISEDTTFEGSEFDPPISGYILQQANGDGGFIRTSRNKSPIPTILDRRYVEVTYSGTWPDIVSSAVYSGEYYGVNFAGAWPKGCRDCYAFADSKKYNYVGHETYELDDIGFGTTIVLPNGSEVNLLDVSSMATDLRSVNFTTVSGYYDNFSLYVSSNSFGNGGQYFISFPGFVTNQPYDALGTPFAKGFGGLLVGEGVLNNYSFIGYV